MPLNLPVSWQLPELTQINRLPARATLFPYPTRGLAKGNDPVDSPWVMSLDGDWAFRLYEKPGGVPSRAVSPGYGDKGWDRLPVPSNWTMHGHGSPQYTNILMPFENDPPRVPDANPTGVYRRAFRLPKGWKGRRTVLHFGGAESVLYVYVNGGFVGMAKDTRLPSEFDVTDHLKPGVNHVTAVVVQWSDASYVEDQDQWWHGGLYREVFLYSQEGSYLKDVFARGGLDGAYRHGELSVEVTLGHAVKPAEPIVVRAELLGPDGKPVLAEPLEGVLDGDFTYHEDRLALEAKVKDVAVWSAESPALYTLIVSLHHTDTKGRAAAKGFEYASTRVGFRTVAVSDRQLLINGKPVMMRGVNRHEHDDTTGKALSTESMIEDIRLMKRHNFNAVRNSHYPNDRRWYALCDEYGLYVIDEADVETHHNYSTICRDPRYERAFFERGRDMVLRTKNHPSVILWSLGNESGYGENHNVMADWVRAYDPTRPLHYEGTVKAGWRQGRMADRPGGKRASDLVCPMYTGIPEIIRWAKTTKDDRPLILCEYSHAMGNSNGCLKEYWDAFERYHGLQGGFIWEWIDHGIRQTTKEGEVYWAYGGDFGEKIHDAEFVCDGLIGPDRVPHPAMAECHKLQQPVGFRALDLMRGRLEVTNKDWFVGLSWLAFDWSIEVDGKRMAGGELKVGGVKPQAAKAVSVGSLSRHLKPGREAFLMVRAKASGKTAWCERGHVVAWEQFALPVEPAPVKTPARRHGEVGIKRGRATTRVLARSGGVEVSVDERSARIKRIAVGGESVVTDGPGLNVWRGPTSNDGVKGKAEQWHAGWKPLGRWSNAGLDGLKGEPAGPASVKAKRGGGVVIGLEQSYRFEGTVKGMPDAAVVEHLITHGLRLVVEPDGSLVFDHRFEVSEELPDLPRIGVMQTVAAGFDGLAWFGPGPIESYPDRKAGTPVGRYRQAVDEQYVPYVLPQEHGHHTDARWLELSDGEGRVVRVEAGDRLGFNASRFTPMDLTRAYHTPDLEPRETVCLCLDAAHRGLGTASCGPDTLGVYKVGPGRYRLRYTLRFLGF